MTVLGITLGGADAGNYTFNTSATTTANITLTAPPPPPPPPAALDSGLPNTVVKVSQDPSSTVPTPPDDGVFATPVTAYVLVYLPNNAPLTNRINNQPPPVRVPQARFGLAAYDAPDEEKRWGKNRWKGRRLLAGPDKTFIYDANIPAFRRRGGFGASPDIKSI